MSIITLTTDLGIADFYLASVKGKIYTELGESVKIVDISNNIPIFDITNAAFTLQNCFTDFPKGTIHIVSVDGEVNSKTIPLLIKYKGHYFIGADNGLFSLAFTQKVEEIYELTINYDSNVFTFPAKNIFVKAACHLARGGTPELIGKRIPEIKRYQNIRPTTSEEVIRGSVIYKDSYGNLITNISATLFKEVGKGRQFIIRFKNHSITTISSIYSAVPPGEKLAIFNSGNYLEIAINRGVQGSGGSAAQLLGLAIKDTILVEFL